MAILKAVNVKIGRNANLKGIINYVLQSQKTEERLTYGYCCDVPEALNTMNETKSVFGKTKGRQYYHFIHSFPPTEKITPQDAHNVAIKFVEQCKKFWGFEMILATHKDRKHIHTHFVMNSVSFIDGHKFHITKKELAEMKELQNQICISLGFSKAPQKGVDMFGKKRNRPSVSRTKSFFVFKKHNDKQIESYVMDCSRALERAVKMAHNKEQFILLMKSQGFETEWKDSKKHITFTDINRKENGEKKYKIRLQKLSDYFPNIHDYSTKEELINEFNENIITSANRTSHTRKYGDKRKTRAASKRLDFNSEYEQFSAKCNKKCSVQPNENDARQSAGNPGQNRIRTANKQNTEQSNNESDIEIKRHSRKKR